MILYYFSLKMEGNKIKSLAKSQYDTLLLADTWGVFQVKPPDFGWGYLAFCD